MSNSVAPDDTAQDLCCLQKPIIIARSSESKRITFLFDFTYDIEKLNFSIPLSHTSM